MTRKTIGMAILGLAAIGMGFSAASSLEDTPASKEPTSLYGIDYAEEYAVAQLAFEQRDPANAVAFLNSRYRSQGYDEETIHLLEHLVGEALFLMEGREGLSLCSTDSPLLGCYHGFFAAAFPREDEAFFERAEETCRSLEDAFRMSACIHGIGHGLSALQGRENVLEALKMCDRVSYSLPFGREMCYTGVFMEYNTASSHGPSIATAAREFDPDRPYFPCDEMPESYQQACYLQLGHWWGETDELRNRFAEMGRLCGNVPGADKNRESCFRSVGMVAARFARMDPEETNASCQQMPQEGLAFCLEEAAVLLSIHKKENALDVCAAEFRQRCADYLERFFCETLLVCES